MKAARVELPVVISPPLIPIVQRDDGFYEIGLGDNPPGPFESIGFASAVAAKMQRSMGARA
jgi:hypothetical protein